MQHATSRNTSPQQTSKVGYIIQHVLDVTSCTNHGKRNLAHTSLFLTLTHQNLNHHPLNSSGSEVALITKFASFCTNLKCDMPHATFKLPHTYPTYEPPLCSCKSVKYKKTFITNSWGKFSNENTSFCKDLECNMQHAKFELSQQSCKVKTTMASKVTPAAPTRLTELDTHIPLLCSNPSDMDHHSISSKRTK